MRGWGGGYEGTSLLARNNSKSISLLRLEVLVKLVIPNLVSRP